jgi:hypothetical protein
VKNLHCRINTHQSDYIPFSPVQKLFTSGCLIWREQYVRLILHILWAYGAKANMDMKGNEEKVGLAEQMGCFIV